MQSNEQLLKKLDEIINNKDYTNNDNLKRYVAQDIKENAEQYNDNGVMNYLKDLQQSGCASGIVSELIYYKDTHAFYDKYYYEIEDMRNEYEENINEPLKIKSDLKNFFAWFAYEETAYQIALNDLNLDI